MVDMQIVRRATELASPPVSFEHLIPERLVLSQRELQPRPFLIKFTHRLPWPLMRSFGMGDSPEAARVLWQESFSRLYF
jgi:hypothetical protein